MQSWEDLENRGSSVFFLNGILGDLISAVGGLELWNCGVPQAGKSFPRHGLNAPMFVGELLGG